MNYKYNTNDIVGFTIAGVQYQSKVFGVSENGDYLYVDYLEGNQLIHRREKPILAIDAYLLFKSVQTSFSREEIISILRSVNVK